jgi:hypothetical protein
MKTIETIAIIVLALPITLMAYGFGAMQGLPKKVKVENIEETLIPDWLHIVFGILVYIAEVAAGLYLRERYMLVCGAWLFGGFAFGFLLERISWIIAPPKNFDEWLMKKKENKAAKGGVSLSEAFKQGGTTAGDIIAAVISIAVVGLILWFAVPAAWKWVKAEYFTEKPWKGLYYADVNSLVAEEKNFKLLEECRQWANDQADRESKQIGEWDYSCGFKCEYSDNPIRKLGPGINYDCENVTK